MLGLVVLVTRCRPLGRSGSDLHLDDHPEPAGGHRPDERSARAVDPWDPVHRELVELIGPGGSSLDLRLRIGFHLHGRHLELDTGHHREWPLRKPLVDRLEGRLVRHHTRLSERLGVALHDGDGRRPRAVPERSRRGGRARPRGRVRRRRAASPSEARRSEPRSIRAHGDRFHGAVKSSPRRIPPGEGEHSFGPRPEGRVDRWVDSGLDGDLARSAHRDLELASVVLDPPVGDTDLLADRVAGGVVPPEREGVIVPVSSWRVASATRDGPRTVVTSRIGESRWSWHLIVAFALGRRVAIPGIAEPHQGRGYEGSASDRGVAGLQ